MSNTVETKTVEAASAVPATAGNAKRPRKRIKPSKAPVSSKSLQSAWTDAQLNAVCHHITEQYIRDNHERLRQLRCRDEAGKERFYVLFVPQQFERAFWAATKPEGSQEWRRYARIVGSCEGSTCTPCLQALMFREYAFRA